MWIDPGNTKITPVDRFGSLFGRHPKTLTEYIRNTKAGIKLSTEDISRKTQEQIERKVLDISKDPSD